MIEIPVHCGNDFENIAKQAKEMAAAKNANIQFKFNGVKCLINANTNLEWLRRDYHNSHLMDWKSIGADCVSEYAPDVIVELERKSEERRIKAEADEKEYAEKNANQKAAFLKRIEGIEMEFCESETKENFETIKQETKESESGEIGYAGTTLEFAENWAKLMQVEISENGYSKIDISIIDKISDKTEYGYLGWMGMSGHTYNWAVKILSQFWIHGEELRKWHNKKCGVEGDGTAMPSIINRVNNGQRKPNTTIEG